jgi:CRP-like cAMP-binding protein
MPMKRQFQKNQILALLPEPTFAAWSDHLELVNLPMGKVLFEAGPGPSHVYFPTTAIVSFVYVLENGGSAEVAMTGREGMAGMYLLMGGGKSHNRAIVYTPGQAARLPLKVLQDSFQLEPEVQRIFLLFMQALVIQMAQIAVCHRHHTLEQQLCRMLLLVMDRLEGRTIEMTREVISQLMGVRREGVTLAAKRLMQEGVIHYARGRITIIDRHTLEHKACECYGVIRFEYARLLRRCAHA